MFCFYFQILLFMSRYSLFFCAAIASLVALGIVVVVVLLLLSVSTHPLDLLGHRLLVRRPGSQSRTPSGAWGWG